MGQIQVEPNSVESWKIAENYAGLLGEIPPFFSSAVRVLRAQKGDVDERGYTDVSQSLVIGILKSPGLFVPSLHAALELRPGDVDSIANPRDIKPFHMLKLFSAEEMASLVATVFLFRRITKKLEDSDEWGRLLPLIIPQLEVGTQLGLAIPKIGAGRGMILGCIRYLALALILSHDEKNFVPYRRRLEKEGILCDLDFESKQWGCTHLQIGATLLQHLGFGRDAATGLSVGLAVEDVDAVELDPESFKWQLAALWIQALRSTGEPPNIRHRGDYYPKQDDYDRLIEVVREINEGRSNLKWLFKNKENSEIFAAAPAPEEVDDEEGDAIEELFEESAPA